MKKLFLLFLLLTLGCTTAPETTQEQIPATIIVNFGDNQVTNQADFPAGTSAFEAFSAFHDLTSTNYGFDRYISAIDGVVQDPKADIYWQYYIDGIYATKGTVQYKITKPVTLEFKYELNQFSNRNKETPSTP